MYRTQGWNDLNRLIKILIVNFYYDLVMPNTGCAVQ